jgi:hypothetical protein
MKEGTKRTFVRMHVAEIFIVPTCVTSAKEPLGSLTFLETTTVMVVRKKIEPYGQWHWY